MAITGNPSLSKIIAEFGADAGPSLLDYLRGGGRVAPGNPANSAISKTAAGILLSQFAGAALEVILTITGNVHQYNVQAAYAAAHGTPTEAVWVRVVINSGAHVFSGSPATAAIIVGSLPAGSRVTIENNGTITGARGAPNSGAGGDCIRSTNGVPVFLINTGLIRPGGGGGGVGGTGGGGVYQTSYNESLGLGQNVSSSCNGSCTTTHGAGAFCQSAGFPDCDVNPTFNTYQCSNCQRTVYVNNYTSGGSGGAGGGGFGCLDGIGTVANAAAGSAGAGGGTNAGTGGTGGSGGASGAAGGTGNTGSSGNYTGGTAGSGGGAGGRFRATTAGLFTLVSNTGTINGSGADV